jgi:hypothetical protein
MDAMTIIAVVGAVVCLVLYLRRRRARLRADD